MTRVFLQWCGGVMRVKRWLDKREIPYTEIDISKDREAARYVENLNDGHQSVPTILMRGSLFNGYFPRKVAYM